MRRICMVIAVLSVLFATSDAFARCRSSRLFQRPAKRCRACQMPCQPRQITRAAKETAEPFRAWHEGGKRMPIDQLPPATPKRQPESIDLPKRKSEDETLNRLKKTFDGTSLPVNLPSGTTPDGKKIYMLSEEQYKAYQNLIQQ